MIGHTILLNAIYAQSPEAVLAGATEYAAFRKMGQW